MLSLYRTAFHPSFGRFIENDKKELLPNPAYFRIEDDRLAREYEFIGRLLGKSLYANIMLGMKFAGPFLNLLINNKNTFDDLQQIDASLYKSLIYIA
jgi:ubiquitin-protein ligase E3 C